MKIEILRTYSNLRDTLTQNGTARLPSQLALNRANCSCDDRSRRLRDCPLIPSLFRPRIPPSLLLTYATRRESEIIPYLAFKQPMGFFREREVSSFSVLPNETKPSWRIAGKGAAISINFLLLLLVLRVYVEREREREERFKTVSREGGQQGTLIELNRTSGIINNIVSLARVCRYYSRKGYERLMGWTTRDECGYANRSFLQPCCRAFTRVNRVNRSASRLDSGFLSTGRGKRFLSSRRKLGLLTFPFGWLMTRPRLPLPLPFSPTYVRSCCGNDSVSGVFSLNLILQILEIPIIFFVLSLSLSLQK